MQLDYTGAKELVEFVMEKATDAESKRMDLCGRCEHMAHEIKEIRGVPHRWDFTNEKWIPMDIPLPKEEPTPKPIEFFTMDGLVDYINENSEHLIPEDGTKVILQVLNEREIALISQPSAIRKERNLIAYCKAHVPQITFERYMDTDTFCTELLSKYIETEARKLLFSVVKSMTKEQSANVSDDGVGQQITVKDGISLASNVQFQNPVPLRPRRTFSEIEQPESNFTLRVDRDANAALFESDGGAWKNDAVAYIRAYLIDNIVNPAVVVIA